MPNYSVPTIKALASTSPSCIGFVASAATVRRSMVYFISLSSYDTPSDSLVRWNVNRITAIGSGAAAVLPIPLDLADATAVCIAGQAPTTDVTPSGVALLDVGVHLRNTFEWFAPPRGELVGDATLNHGIAVRTATLTGANVTPSVNATFHYSE